MDVSGDLHPIHHVARDCSAPETSRPDMPTQFKIGLIMFSIDWTCSNDRSSCRHPVCLDSTIALFDKLCIWISTGDHITSPKIRVPSRNLPSAVSVCLMRGNFVRRGRKINDLNVVHGRSESQPQYRTALCGSIPGTHLWPRNCPPTVHIPCPAYPPQSATNSGL